MKTEMMALILALISPFPACSAVELDKSVDPLIKTEEKIFQIQRFLESSVDTRDFPEEMSFVKFLAAMEGKVPDDKKVSLKIDEEAFGKQLPQVAGATIRPLHVKNVSFETVLRKALAQVSTLVDVDYGIRPTGVIITRPPLAAHSMVYDVRDLVKQMPMLLPNVKRHSGDIFQDIKPTDGSALLVSFLANGVEMREWETMQLINDARLAVLASPTRHQTISNGIEVLRRLSDNAVVMNARLYEVDRAWFAKQVAPLFASDKDTEERPTVVRIDGTLFKKISQKKLVLESEDIMIGPNQHAPFLSQHNVFRFNAGPRRMVARVEAHGRLAQRADRSERRA